MTLKEYLGDWWPLFDEKELNVVVGKLQRMTNYTPSLKEIFTAFKVCPRNKCKVVILGQDPYPQPGIATGIAFANKEGTVELSPSLNIIKNAACLLENPKDIRIFDPTLVSIANQGVLFLNTALTVEVNNPGSHQLLWYAFIRKFLVNLSEYEPGLIYLLLGSTARGFKPFINSSNHIIECNHPSYYARTDTRMPDVFTEVNKVLEWQYGQTIEWFKDTI